MDDFILSVCKLISYLMCSCLSITIYVYVFCLLYFNHCFIFVFFFQFILPFIKLLVYVMLSV